MPRAGSSIVRVRRVLGVSGLLLAALLPSCAPPPPSEEAVLWYFRNVPIHGEVRRIWPEGQAYVDSVLKAHAAVMKSLEPLEEQTTVLSLWPTDDPRWQDAKAVKSHTDELKKLSVGARHERDVLLQEFKEALQATPDGLGLDTPEKKGAFVEKAWAALSPPGGELLAARAALEARIAERLQLHQIMRDTPEFAEAHRTLDAEFRAAREASIALAETRMSEIDRRLENLDKRGERDEYGTLFWEHRYHRKILENIPKAVYAAREAAEQELAELQEQVPPTDAEARAKHEAQIAFLEAQIERLTTDHTALKDRTAQVLNRDEATSPNDPEADI